LAQAFTRFNRVRIKAAHYKMVVMMKAAMKGTGMKKALPAPMKVSSMKKVAAPMKAPMKGTGMKKALPAPMKATVKKATTKKPTAMKKGKPSTMKKAKPSTMKAPMKAMKKGGMKKTTMKKKKAMKRVSKVGKGKRAKLAVFSGIKEKTVGGLKKTDLIKNKAGKVVSKKRSDLAKNRYKKNGLNKWIDATKAARKALNVTGFCAIGGKTELGQSLLKKTQSIYKK